MAAIIGCPSGRRVRGAKGLPLRYAIGTFGWKVSGAGFQAAGKLRSFSAASALCRLHIPGPPICCHK